MRSSLMSVAAIVAVSVVAFSLEFIDRQARAQVTWEMALSQPGWNLPEFKQAAEAYGQGDCLRAWALLWPFAKKGSHEARYLLWALTIDRMILPGLRSKSGWTTHDLVLAAYAALVPATPHPPPGDPEHRGARKAIQDAINGLELGENGARVAHCYKSGTSFQACLDLAVSLGVVQRFEDYAADVEDTMRETRTQASCRPRH
jgi:hypothetical protein